MLKIIGCFADKHDLSLVALAVVICSIATTTAVQLLRLARDGGPKVRTVWLIVAAFSSGIGIFATHFIGLLAFEPNIRDGFDLPLTLLSLIIAIGLTGAGLWQSLQPGRASPWIGGGLVGSGIAAMHYTGMAAYQIEGHLSWEPRLVLISLGLGMAIATAAIRVGLTGGAAVSALLASLLLTLAICSLHFTSMAAVTIVLDPTVGLATGAMDAETLTRNVVVVSMALMLPTCAVLVLHLRNRRRIAHEAVRIRQLVDAAVEGLIICRDSRIITANDSFSRLTGARVESLVGQPIDRFLSDIPHLDDGNRGEERMVETYLRDTAGDSVEVEVIVRTIAIGSAPHQSIAVRDVRERKRAEAELECQRALMHASEQRFRLLAENSNDVILLGDLDMRVVYASPVVRMVMGYDPEEIVGLIPFDFVHPDDAPTVSEIWMDIHSAGHERTVSCMRHRHKNGHYVWIEVSIRLARNDQDGRPIGYVAALRDITERRETEEQIRQMAMHDALTGLPNRRLFRDRLDQAIALTRRTRHPFAVMACDLDRFKAVNDSLGHPAGDALLCVVAGRMRSVLRPYDTIARLGGDEFAIVVAHLDEPCSASCIAERLIAVVSEPINLDGNVVEVGISVGITVSADQENGADELFKRADIALYEAKAGGRSTFREFEPQAAARIRNRGQLGLDMNEAIRRGEFRLVYQPVIDATTGAVVSFEALMRWHHLVQGEISPATFIPLAEETGLIVPLGVWALREACREAVNWPGDIRVAVNVSVVQLRRDGLETAVMTALAASGLPPNRLKLEVTESVLMQDADGVLACLHRLRGLGVAIALDDFGTGYSSLSYLRRFPFDKIKIDRAFIRDIGDPDAAAIVRAVVGIGERLGMGIVAEGVETAEQLNLVRREGCTQVQGFLFSRPLDPQEASRYIDTALARVA